jgi:peptide deformylase
MTVRPIRLFGDPVLRSSCDPIAPGDPRAKVLIDDLLYGVALP